MLLPELFQLGSNLRRDYLAGTTPCPVHFRDGSRKCGGGQDLVRRWIDNGLKVHVHITGRVILATPVDVLVWLGSEMADSDNTRGLVITYPDEEKTVTGMGVLIVSYAPVEVVRGPIPFLRIGEDIFPFREVKIVKEPVQFVTGEKGIPSENERIPVDVYLYRSRAASWAFLISSASHCGSIILMAEPRDSNGA